MTDLEELIALRIEGRNWHEFILTDMDPDELAHVVSFVNGELCIVIIPVVADGAILLETHAFIDGQGVGRGAAEVRRKT